MLIKKAIIAAVIIFSGINAYAQLTVDDLVITTKVKEKFVDKNGQPLTGKGVVIGDVDSGIDVFHPFYFFADGGEFDWIDANGDGAYTPGSDAVDVNSNGTAEPEEIIRHIKMNNKTYGLIKGSRDFEADMDFIYNDKNGNRKRDFGVKDGFTEQDPTYGEQYYIVRDVNGNNKLDTGEKLSALGTSKVKAVREKNGTVRRRGTDLIMTERDTIEHGTHVASIIMGGHYGVGRLHGIAPDAEMVFANIKYDYTPRFVKNFPDMLNFLKSENINIMLLEDGEYMWEFMDGSSEEEQMLNQMARDGITVIGGGGNLAGANAHIRNTITAGSTNTYTISAPGMITEEKTIKNDGIFPTFLWQGASNNISFVVEAPDGKKTKELKTGSGITTAGKYNVFYSREVSSKGTVMFKFMLSKKDSGEVGGEWKIRVKPESNVVLDGFVGDVSQSWSGHTHWTDNTTDEGTVTFPSTADSCIAVGAYTVNYPFFPGDVVNGLSPYSGVGYNVDGSIGIDIVGPGHTTFTAAPDNAYEIFSGTSSAAPHVVGAAALLLQYDPTLTHTQIRNILLTSALKDSFTGNVPNTDWGYGKLDIEKALRYITGTN